MSNIIARLVFKATGIRQNGFILLLVHSLLTLWFAVWISTDLGSGPSRQSTNVDQTVNHSVATGWKKLASV